MEGQGLQRVTMEQQVGWWGWDKAVEQETR